MSLANVPDGTTRGASVESVSKDTDSQHQCHECSDLVHEDVCLAGNDSGVFPMRQPPTSGFWSYFPDPGEVLLDRAEYLKRGELNKIGSDVEYNDMLSNNMEAMKEYAKTGGMVLSIFIVMGITVASQTRGKTPSAEDLVLP